MGDRITTAVASHGRWREILPSLGVHPKVLNGKNQPCPACGGTDRFRFTDRHKDGDYYCNQCGAGKGIGLLMKVHGWDFKTAAQQVDALLGRDTRISMHPSSAERAFQEWEIKIPKSVRDCAVWIRKYHPGKLEAWIEQHDITVRWWLETQ